MSSASGFLYLREEKQTILSVNQCYERSFFLRFLELAGGSEAKYRKGIFYWVLRKKDPGIQQITEAASGTMNQSDFDMT